MTTKSVILLVLIAGFFLAMISTAQEIKTCISEGTESTHIDLQSYTGDPRQLWITPDGSIHAVYFGSGPNVGTDRRSYYVYSSDNGQHFTTATPIESSNSDWAALTVTKKGLAMITSTRVQDPSPPYNRIFIQNDIGSKSFTCINAPQVPSNTSFPRISCSDSLIILLSSRKPGTNGPNVWNVYNINNNSFKGFLSWNCM